MIWNNHRCPLSLTQSAHVMGILNTTPDSFSDGSKHLHLDDALAHARAMIADGATLIDVGGESSRPGAAPVPADQEIHRTAEMIRLLRQEWNGLISIDTTKAAVAAAALHAGADIVNDISGLTADPLMTQICADWQCGVVIMHMQGSPQSMQLNPSYLDVTAEVREFFTQRFLSLTDAGIHPDHLVFDPGIGFGKSLDHNRSLLNQLSSLAPFSRPILLGVSRKSLFGHLLDDSDLSLRNWPTVAVTALARHSGVLLHRVHEVKPNLHALRMTEAILHAH